MAPAARRADSEEALLLGLAKEAFHRQIAKRVRGLARGFVERWEASEFWLYTSVVQRHATELRAYRPVVLEVLRNADVDEMLALCRETRPDLDDLWKAPAARERLAQELARSIEAVEAL